MPTMVIGFRWGLAVNIPANHIFIHGRFGMPKLAASAVAWPLPSCSGAMLL